MTQFIYENLSFCNHSHHPRVDGNIFSIQHDGTSHFKISDLGFANTFLRVIFVFISRLGFILIELGSIPIENVYKIIFYNILELANTIISYAFIGYMLSFGKMSFNGLVGYSDELNYEMDRVIFGFSAALLGSAQISTFIVGRIHLTGSIIVTFLYTSIFQSILMHWIWNANGWMYKFSMLNEIVSVKDHGGNLVIHLSSSIIGVIGAIFLGRRIIKIKELDELSVGKEHTVTTVVGYIFIIFGYISFILPSPISESIKCQKHCMSTVLVNSLIAFGSGILTNSIIKLCMYKTTSNYWSVLGCIQGGMAGLISISSAADIYTPLICAGTASVSSILFLIVSLLIHVTALEDHCSFTASHMLCSFFGCLTCPILINKEYLTNVNRKYFMLWQSICLITVAITSVIVGVSLFSLLHWTKFLRSKREVKNHNRAVALQQHLPERPFLDRLFHINFQTSHIAPGENYRKKFIGSKRWSHESSDGPAGDAETVTL